MKNLKYSISIVQQVSHRRMPPHTHVARLMQAQCFYKVAVTLTWLFAYNYYGIEMVTKVAVVSLRQHHLLVYERF